MQRGLDRQSWSWRLLATVGLTVAVAHGQQPNVYCWARAATAPTPLAERFAPPAGYVRVPAAAGSFAAWLRELPLQPATAPVHLFNGELKADQSVHAAVLDLDVGTRDLQQCADAVIRLRAEYLFSTKRFAAIQFNFTSGDPAAYGQWRAGFRPEVGAKRVRWLKQAAPDDSYAGFRKYLDTVFTYAGTQSLSRELLPRRGVAELQAGDVFIRGGSPGHAVLVVDVARHPASGAVVFLLAQSYMPAQEVHILKNPAAPGLSPWYASDFGETLRTPEWKFAATELRYFPEPAPAGPAAGGR